jgi:polar amino acid transport system permease protein
MASLWDFLPYMLVGVEWTLGLVGGGLAVGFALGLSIAIIQTFGNETIKVASNLYVWFFRSIPLLVLLFVFFWGILPALGFQPDPFSSSIVVLGLRSAAFQSQILRGAILSVGEGQLVAARAVGMNRLKAARHVLLPQALRIALPGWSNEYAGIMKDSAICFALGVLEILTRTRYVVIATSEPLTPYFVAGGLFLVLTYGGTAVLHLLYEKIKVPGLIGRE